MAFVHRESETGEFAFLGLSVNSRAKTDKFLQQPLPLPSAPRSRVPQSRLEAHGGCDSFESSSNSSDWISPSNSSGRDHGRQQRLPLPSSFSLQAAPQVRNVSRGAEFSTNSSDPVSQPSSNVRRHSQEQSLPLLSPPDTSSRLACHDGSHSLTSSIYSCDWLSQSGGSSTSHNQKDRFSRTDSQSFSFERLELQHSAGGSLYERLEVHHRRNSKGTESSKHGDAKTGVAEHASEQRGIANQDSLEQSSSSIPELDDFIHPPPRFGSTSSEPGLASLVRDIAWLDDEWDDPENPPLTLHERGYVISAYPEEESQAESQASSEAMQKSFQNPQEAQEDQLSQTRLATPPVMDGNKVSASRIEPSRPGEELLKAGPAVTSSKNADSPLHRNSSSSGDWRNIRHQLYIHHSQAGGPHRGHASCFSRMAFSQLPQLDLAEAMKNAAQEQAGTVTKTNEEEQDRPLKKQVAVPEATCKRSASVPSVASPAKGSNASSKAGGSTSVSKDAGPRLPQPFAMLPSRSSGAKLQVCEHQSAGHIQCADSQAAGTTSEVDSVFRVQVLESHIKTRAPSGKQIGVSRMDDTQEEARPSQSKSTSTEACNEIGTETSALHFSTPGMACLQASGAKAASEHAEAPLHRCASNSTVDSKGARCQLFVKEGLQELQCAAALRTSSRENSCRPHVPFLQLSPVFSDVQGRQLATERAGKPTKISSPQKTARHTARSRRALRINCPVTFYIEGRPQQLFGRMRCVDDEGTYSVELVGGGRMTGLDALTACSEMELLRAERSRFQMGIQSSRSNSRERLLSKQPVSARATSSSAAPKSMEPCRLQLGTPVTFVEQGRTYYGRLRTADQKGFCSVNIAGGGIKIGIPHVDECTEKDLENHLQSRRGFFWQKNPGMDYGTRNHQPNRVASARRGLSAAPSEMPSLNPSFQRVASAPQVRQTKVLAKRSTSAGNFVEPTRLRGVAVAKLLPMRRQPSNLRPDTVQASK
eukprot:TRINITY_DN42498_c0_g1_i1.p1 TRINITY_DN42498_c0_g1~~TRINITY_DN42498_c0_g1_i1.p1  ORF type:complete len:987 (-),score=175.06 TRINITY_DN42498_c0_g1_i1:214-3174(-)